MYLSGGSSQPGAMAECCGPQNRFVSFILCSVTLIFVVQGELSTSDTNIVGYVSETITLPCEHEVKKSNLESVVWKKLQVGKDEAVAEYHHTDDPTTSLYGSMVGRATVIVFPSILKFSNGSLSDEAIYECVVYPVDGQPSFNRYQLTVNAKPRNEAIILNGRSYHHCEEVYLPENAPDLLSLSCTASSKPSSRFTWISYPVSPALVVNQSMPQQCNTMEDGVRACVHNVTVVTKDLTESTKLTCLVQFDDRRSMVTGKACVILVPYGYHSVWFTVLMILLTLWLIGVVVVLVIIALVWTLHKRENKSAPIDLRHLGIGVLLVILLPAVGIAIFVFLTFYWKLLPGKKAESEKSVEELGEREGLRAASNDKEDEKKRNVGEDEDINGKEDPVKDPIDPDINTM